MRIDENGILVFDSEHEKHKCMIAFYAFTKDESNAKKWFEENKLALLSHNNFARADYNAYEAGYANGRDDFIREMIADVDAYKLYMNQSNNK